MRLWAGFAVLAFVCFFDTVHRKFERICQDASELEAFVLAETHWAKTVSKIVVEWVECMSLAKWTHLVSDEFSKLVKPFIWGVFLIRGMAEAPASFSALLPKCLWERFFQQFGKCLGPIGISCGWNVFTVSTGQQGCRLAKVNWVCNMSGSFVMIIGMGLASCACSMRTVWVSITTTGWQVIPKIGETWRLS